jgi:hypothetical protein
MQKKIKIHSKFKLIIPLVTLVLALVFLAQKQSLAYSSFAPSGVTGSPGDGLNCTGCHTGTAQTLSNGITTTIPESGYIPDSIYDITIGNDVAQAGKTLYGFAMTVQKGTSQTLLGSFIGGNGLLIGQNYITHSGAKTSPPEWKFQWKAPATGTGTLTFSTALNAANGNGSTSGDLILLSSLTFNENTPNGLSEINNNAREFKPFVADKQLNLSFYSASLTVFYLQVFDLNGSVIMQKHINASPGDNVTRLSFENEISAGIYLVQLSDYKQRYQAKIVKN